MKKLLWKERRVYFGKNMRRYYCRKCRWGIEAGEEYYRLVYRISEGKSSYLWTVYEHDYDCNYVPPDEESASGKKPLCRITRLPPIPRRKAA